MAARSARARSMDAPGFSRPIACSQNARLAFELCPRAYVLEAGRLVRSGPSAELEQDPAVRNAYLGGGLEVV